MESSQALLNPRDEADQDGLRHTSNSVMMTRTLVQVQQDDCKDICIGLVDKSGGITPSSPLTMADVAASALEEKQFSVTVKDRKPRFKEGVLAKFTPPFPNPKPEDSADIKAAPDLRKKLYQDTVNDEFRKFVEGEESDIYLAFQPIWSARTKTLTGLEVL